LDDTRAVFVGAAALQAKFSLSTIFSRNLGVCQRCLQTSCQPRESIKFGSSWWALGMRDMPRNRADLKRMQPMRLHWAQSLRGPRAMVVAQVVHFCQILLALEKCGKDYQSHC